MKINKKYLALAFVASLLASGGAYAATQSVTANMSFDSLLTLTKNNDISFGTVGALTAGTYVISTAGVVTPSGGGVVVGGTPVSGQITITGSASQTVSISTGTYTTNNGVTPSAATCSYNAGASTACDTPLTGLAAPTGVGKILRLGVTAAVDGTQAANTAAAPTFVVTVVYG
ncbi:MAG: DUF4402 domain-containing protein [Bdellovibrionales bacterium]|jgi:hypothetical protein